MGQMVQIKYLFLLPVFLLAAGSGQAEESAFPPELCKTLTEYQPAVGTEFTPGIDVNGKPVVEADITTSPVRMPEKFSFDLTLDVAAHAGLVTPAGVEGEGKIGTLTLENGRLIFDGKPVEGEGEAGLRAFCASEAGLQKNEKTE